MNYFYLPLEEWTNQFVHDWLIPNFRGIFRLISDRIEVILDLFQTILLWIPPELFTLAVAILAWRTAGKRVALFVLIGFLFIGSVNLWTEAMQLLAIVLSASFFSIVVGVPLGILAAKKEWVNAIVRPILDFMQTLPSFVYLIPTAMLLGLGAVPAVISTFIFATPPAVRLTTLGIRQVPADVVEAARAFGSTSWQMLIKVQLPLAVPSIMAGINQTILLSLSMAVIAAMIGSPGLGSVVLSALTSVNVGKGVIGGLGIVILAIVLDRITASLGAKKNKQGK